MKTLLTGANGLVGSTISADYRLKGKQYLDLRDWEDTYSYFKDFLPEAVIHTAGRVGGLGANMKYMAEFYHDSILINTNVLEAARRTGVKKVVSFLSTCVFPATASLKYPLTESQLHKGEPHGSNFGYAYAKRMLEVHSRAIATQYGLNYICVIPTNIYGPHDNFNLEDSHVLPALIHKCYLAKRDNTDLIVWGSGKPLREFIFSKDVGEITQLILEHYEGTDPMIISTSEETSIREAVNIIADVMGFGGNIIFDDTKPDGQYKKPTSNLRLKSFLPKYEFTPFREGVKQTVAWFVENYEECRK